MLSRRASLIGLLAVGVTARASALSERDWSEVAIEDQTAPILPTELAAEGAHADSLNDDITTYQPFGTHPPTSEETMRAQKVLERVPMGKTPIDVALYFLDVAAGKYGEELRPYATAWPIRWNPVVVEFFTATQTTPAGDTTSWCAAFVNYCLMMSAKGKTLPDSSAAPTRSAASRSFRTWAHATTSPTPGDLVVFQDKASRGHGHVGFFLADKPDAILVLGGNQFEGSPVRHTIDRKIILKSGPALEFLSFRTDPQLHG